MSKQQSELMAKMERLSDFSEESGKLTRTYLTPQLKQASAQIGYWMEQAGMETRVDEVGNLIGRYEGKTPGGARLLLGSHFDTVRNAGQFDGMYGVVAAIAAVQSLNDSNHKLDFAVEVIAFADEEGARFGATLLGSRAIAGEFDDTLLALTDSKGVSMADAMALYGLDPDKIGQAAMASEDLAGYIELHIEQGPVLIDENLPVGIVTAIAGATRYTVTVTGLAGHAGTVPMSMRKDALAASSEAVLLLESLATKYGDGTFCTVGQLSVPDAASNVIAGLVEFSIDLRCGTDNARLTLIEEAMAKIQEIGERRNVSFNIRKTHEAGAAVCAPWLVDQMVEAVKRQGIKPLQLVSGAGHDAMALTRLTDIVMLFVRCGNRGISHHPDETMTTEDAEFGVAVLTDMLINFAPKATDNSQRHPILETQC